MKKIENVHVDSVSEYGRAAIGWDADGARFHVWINTDTGSVEDVLYKNPPVGVEYKGVGHFDTRELDRTNKANAAVWADVMTVVNDGDLIENAIKAFRAEKAREEDICRLNGDRREVETLVMEAWRAGKFNSNEVAGALFFRHKRIVAEIAGIEGSRLPSYEDALQDPVKARVLFEASKGGNVRGITEDHRFALANVVHAAERRMGA